MNKLLEQSCKKLCKLLISNVDSECIICKQTNIDGIMLIPCSHYQLCSSCFKYMKETKCPICRSDIQYYLEYHQNNKIKM